MPQLIALALVGAGLYAGYRWFARATKEITAEIKRTEDELRRGQEKTQELTKDFTERLDKVLKAKEEEIMEV